MTCQNMGINNDSYTLGVSSRQTSFLQFHQLILFVGHRHLTNYGDNINILLIKTIVE